MHVLVKLSNDSGYVVSLLRMRLFVQQKAKKNLKSQKIQIKITTLAPPMPSRAFTMHTFIPVIKVLLCLVHSHTQ